MNINIQAEKEILETVNWWAKNILDLPQTNIDLFKITLRNCLIQKIKNHWYPEEPERGSGYRSILNDKMIDPILFYSCNIANIDPSRMAGKCVLIISPGIVRVRSLKNSKEEIVYQYSSVYK